MRNTVLGKDNSFSEVVIRLIASFSVVRLYYECYILLTVFRLETCYCAFVNKVIVIPPKLNTNLNLISRNTKYFVYY